MSVTFNELENLMFRVLKRMIIPTLVGLLVAGIAFQGLGYHNISLIFYVSAAMITGMGATCGAILEGIRKARLKQPK